MRISDWSSDVCSSDLLRRLFTGLWADIPAADHSFANTLMEALPASSADSGKQDNLLEAVEVFLTGLFREILPEDRKSVGWGKMVSVLVDFGGCRVDKKKKKQ